MQISNLQVAGPFGVPDSLLLLAMYFHALIILVPFLTAAVYYGVLLPRRARPPEGEVLVFPGRRHRVPERIDEHGRAA